LRWRKAEFIVFVLFANENGVPMATVKLDLL